MTARHTTLFKLFFLLYLAVLAWLCFGHFDGLSLGEPKFLGIPKDKIVHFCMFFPFPFLVRWSFEWKADKRWKTLLILAGAVIVGSLVAAASEWGQGLTHYRSADPMDFVADFIGLVSAALSAFIIDSILLKHYD